MKTVSLAAVILAAAVTLPAPAADTGATPAVGAPAPDFSLTSNEGKTVKLSDFKGKWVVLYFYP
ncbi:MAG TPA: redoxin domain-containing protein, partial [Thermoanaerobaculia bacterium]|nr:redoxin domain-containing protein [Thermoanaerobaculia bacterium]